MHIARAPRGCRRAGCAWRATCNLIAESCRSWAAASCTFLAAVSCDANPNDLMIHGTCTHWECCKVANLQRSHVTLLRSHQHPEFQHHMSKSAHGASEPHAYACT